ncbi:Uncharacterised protein [Buttiauxella agrestis]|uniref:Uncharacterized protein n=1 Tax=Buttiauxella agrestis TaxID=82977 RepID=A0A381CBF9_9ENTR|nr:Uncharacterised protein [Buttiauxella agrestis]
MHFSGAFARIMGTILVQGNDAEDSEFVGRIRDCHQSPFFFVFRENWWHISCRIF